jgi:hypothetical protein
MHALTGVRHGEGFQSKRYTYNCKRWIGDGAGVGLPQPELDSSLMYSPKESITVHAGEVPADVVQK